MSRDSQRCFIRATSESETDRARSDNGQLTLSLSDREPFFTRRYVYNTEARGAVKKLAAFFVLGERPGIIILKAADGGSNMPGLY